MAIKNARLIMSSTSLRHASKMETGVSEGRSHSANLYTRRHQTNVKTRSTDYHRQQKNMRV